MLLPLLLLVMLAMEGKAGCRWQNPRWLSDLDSAPITTVSQKRIVSITWTSKQFQSNFACADKFEVGVNDGKLERKVCAVSRVSTGKPSNNFTCKVNLSDEKHCAKEFGFWVTAVNNDHNRGIQRIRSSANSQVEIKCNGTSVAQQVKSSSCYAISPKWVSPPYIKQQKADELSISWNRGQVENSHCLESFSLKYWKAGTFSPKYTNLDFKVTEGQNEFGSIMAVESCKSYTYILTAIGKSGVRVNKEGEMSVSCPGEPFKSAKGYKFSGANLDDKGIIKSTNVWAEATEETYDEPESESEPQGHKDNSVDIMMKDKDSDVDRRSTGSRAINNRLSPETKTLESETSKLKPPTLVALNSSEDSLTWKLGNLDPKIKIDRYQISCWESNNRTEIDPPNALVEKIPSWEGDQEQAITVPHLKPNTTYSCKGGMKVKGIWMFSPKSEKFTGHQNSGAEGQIYYYKLVFIVSFSVAIYCTI